MDANQTEQIRRLLEQRRDELKSVIVDAENVLSDQLTPESGESQVDFNHPADMLKGDPDYEKALRLVRQQRAELAMVTSALDRLDTGDYGKCLSCEREIPFERLLALPYAKHCVNCQKLEEAEPRFSDLRP